MITPTADEIEQAFSDLRLLGNTLLAFYETRPHRDDPIWEDWAEMVINATDTLSFALEAAIGRAQEAR